MPLDAGQLQRRAPICDREAREGARLGAVGKWLFAAAAEALEALEASAKALPLTHPPTRPPCPLTVVCAVGWRPLLQHLPHLGLAALAGRPQELGGALHLLAQNVLLSHCPDAQQVGHHLLLPRGPACELGWVGGLLRPGDWVGGQLCEKEWARQSARERAAAVRILQDSQSPPTRNVAHVHAVHAGQGDAADIILQAITTKWQREVERPGHLICHT
jgi:hypothetical protein